MKALRLQNIRSLGDTDFVEFCPLTLLVGKNSSGKSTFLRSLPLLRQSVEAHTSGPILWYGNLVDFGGFSETLSSFSKGEAIRFGFRLTMKSKDQVRSQNPLLSFNRFRKERFVSPLDVELHLSVVASSKDNSITRIVAIEISAAGQNVEINIGRNGSLERFIVNGQELFEAESENFIVQQASFIPILFRRTKGEVDGSFRHRVPFGRNYLAQSLLVRALQPMFHGNTKSRTVFNAALSIPFGSDEEIYEQLFRFPVKGTTWKESVSRLRVDSPRFQRLRNLVIANTMGDLLQELDQRLTIFASGVKYIKPVRATAERYYRQQDLAVDEVDPEGRNLAMFLRSLTETGRKDFEEWTEKELGWKVIATLLGGHLSVRIENQNRLGYNLTDVGFGFSQILPVIAQLWMMQRKSSKLNSMAYSPLTFAIEQPELHLHPALQATLADVMLRAIRTAHGNNIDLRLIVETHSEAIINRVGQRISQGKISPDHAKVVLFDQQDNSGRSKPRITKFGNNGILEDWPFGFFEPDGEEASW